METLKQSKKMDYTIEVTARGAKRDVYIVFHNGNRRKIFTISPRMASYLLKHIDKWELGALIDVVGLAYMQNICSLIFQHLTSKPGEIPVGQFRFCALIVEENIGTGRFYKGLNGCVVERSFRRLI